jgi:putative Mg2+ transporter-C (MgtC) family protein
MPVHLSWLDVGVRLILTVIAGALVGINRMERGRPAGLRTTILVCLAASVSMIQANLLMPTTGKTPDSFVVFDLMRLPLGILTGMGFIGAGAILRRGEMVQGVTTAATLWLVTIIGLCLGGGQIELGLAALALTLLVLWGLKRLEQAFRQDRHGTLILRSTAEGPTEEAVRATLLAAGYRIGSWDVAYNVQGQIGQRRLRCEARWHGSLDDTKTPVFVDELKQQPGVLAIRWSG